MDGGSPSALLGAGTAGGVGIDDTLGSLSSLNSPLSLSASPKAKYCGDSRLRHAGHCPEVFVIQERIQIVISIGGSFHELPNSRSHIRIGLYGPFERS
jgi:hypothetical protein